MIHEIYKNLLIDLLKIEYSHNGFFDLKKEEKLKVLKNYAEELVFFEEYILTLSFKQFSDDVILFLNNEFSELFTKNYVKFISKDLQNILEDLDKNHFVKFREYVLSKSFLGNYINDYINTHTKKEMISSIEKQLHVYSNLQVIKLTTAVPLDKTISKNIKDSLKNMVVYYKNDSTIIGGAKALINGKLYDYSFSNLFNLRKFI